MGRRRDTGNERLGEHVQRRSSRALELRFPLPEDVRHAFLDGEGRPRKQVIKSLGTSDVKLGNAKADILRSSIRDQIHRTRAMRSSDALGEYLQSLHDYEIADFRRRQELDEGARRRIHFRVPGATAGAAPSAAFFAAARQGHAAALLSDNPAEVFAAASWAANEFYHRRGEEPDVASPEYRVVLERCAVVLTDAIIAQDAIEAGRSEPTPLSEFLRSPAKPGVPSTALTDRGRLPISKYFETVYAPVEVSEAGPSRGERNIPGKRHSVRLLVELLGDMPVGTITKGDLYQLLDDLGRMPDVRSLSGEQKTLSAPKLVERMKTGALVAEPLSPKTANKHLSNISAILQFAERRRDVNSADSRGVKARIGDDAGAGRSFTTAELNRIFALPLFSGCMGDEVEAGLFKSGAVRVRDDRFWIPLLLLFTGARSSEVVGMLTTEVVTDHETPHLLLQPNSIRRLKNMHSNRMVPIHSRLIRMGFLDFVSRRELDADPRLFPMAVQMHYRDGATGQRFPKALSSSLIMRQFNRTLLPHADARKDGGTVRCFRNTFEQESMAKIESDEVRQRLTGRKVVSTSRIYTKNVPYDPVQRSAQLLRLHGDLESITYSAVMLDHLDIPT